MHAVAAARKPVAATVNLTIKPPATTGGSPDSNTSRKMAESSEDIRFWIRFALK
jgi:hypothetical protein